MKAIVQAHESPPLTNALPGDWNAKVYVKRHRKVWMTWYERHLGGPWEKRGCVVLPSGPFPKKRSRRMAGK